MHVFAHRPWPAILLGLLLGLILAPATLGETPETAPSYQWLDTNGEPLPFQSDDAIVEFLETAAVVNIQDIPIGVTKPKKLVLEKDGVRVHAAFRTLHKEQQRARLADGSFQMFFIDSYRNEVAAYEMSRILGMQNLPPAVLRKIKRDDGSVQIWLEGTMRYQEQLKKGMNAPPATVPLRNQQRADMVVFDNLINNIDRTQQNIMVDANWDLWMIDHTRSFGRGADLPQVEKMHRCSRRLWEQLQALDEAAVTERLSPYLGKAEIKGMLKRQKKLVTLIEKKIAKEGEQKVLFNYGEVPGVKISVDESSDG